MVKATLPHLPWTAPPGKMALGILTSKAFVGHLTPDDMKFMAVAILQMSDDLAVLRCRMDQLEKRLNNQGGG